MTETQEDAEDAGTRFPFISLGKAMDRAQQIYNAAGVLAVTPKDIFETWGYSPKSSGGFQTIAALKSYGILKQVARKGEVNKLQLSQNAIVFFREERHDKRMDLLKSFALEPPLLKVLWTQWGFTPPADHIARSHLKVDRSLSEQSARTLLGIFKENIDYAELKSDSMGYGASVQMGMAEPPRTPDPNAPPVLPPEAPASHGIKIMEAERIVFTEEGQPNQYLKLIASGDVDGVLLEALEDFVRRQRKRLGIVHPAVPQTT